MPEITAPGANPLKKYFRQAKVFIDLPSKGQFYPAGALDMPETGELPVFAMTAKDELMMKTPDALLNGQATVDVIQSCIPNIKDAWKMPSIDLDACLIAIRIATYGDELEITTKVPNIGEDRAFKLDLRQVLQRFVSTEYDNKVEVGPFLVTMRPLTYREFTDSNLKTFEEQRVFRLVNDEKTPDEEKLAKFNESFQKLTQLTVGMMCNSIASITVEGNTVDNALHIKDFIDNADKEIFAALLEHLEDQKKKFEMEPLKVKSTPEDIEAGAPETWEVPITFDQSNFFA